MIASRAAKRVSGHAALLTVLCAHAAIVAALMQWREPIEEGDLGNDVILLELAQWSMKYPVTQFKSRDLSHSSNNNRPVLPICRLRLRDSLSPGIILKLLRYFLNR